MRQGGRVAGGAHEAGGARSPGGPRPWGRAVRGPPSPCPPPHQDVSRIQAWLRRHECSVMDPDQGSGCTTDSEVHAPNQ